MQRTDSATDHAPRYAANALLECARALLLRAGMAEPLARDVAEVLLEGDLLGHDTHGLALLAPYLGEIERGAMRREGSHVVVAERAAVATWDGQRLPGQWLTRRAVDAAIERARTYGTATVVVRRSHHIGCLAAYLPRATEQGLVLLLACSDPNAASVAPFGGTRAFVTPNPLACGFPTAGDPVLIDISASVTTNGMSARLHRQGRRFAHPWLIDANGDATDDPATLFADPPGTILPLGGLEAGHKGYGLALTIEALTAGLAGFGRADPKEGWGATVFVQALDPAAFGGANEFVRQAEWLREACRSNPPRPGVDRVRLPGERGLARRREQLAHGVALNAEILAALAPWADRFGVALPAAL
ncbi:MAG: Ldh family oxidoreductase [Pseudomonadota bacterium]